MKLFIEYFDKTVGIVTQSTKTAITYLSSGGTKIDSIIEYSKTKLILLGGKFYDEYLNLFTENTTVIDSTVNSINKPQQETVLLQEIYSNEVEKGFIESTAVTERIGKGYNKEILESIAITENVFLVKASTVVTGETVGVTDDLNGVATDDDQIFDIFKPLTEATLVLDSIVRGIDSNKSDLVGITSSGVVGNQDFGSDYFLEDYVGVSTTIS